MVTVEAKEPVLVSVGIRGQKLFAWHGGPPTGDHHLTSVICPLVICPLVPTPRPPLAGLSDSHIRDGDRRRIKRKRGNKPQRHKEHQERRTLTDALSDQKAFSESATVLKKSRPLCALGVLVVFLTAEKLTTKTRRAPRARHFLPSGAASIPVAEALFGSVERQPLGVLGVLVVHRPAGQDASGRKCVKTVALPGEGAPAAPANRTPVPFMGEVGSSGARTLCILKLLPLPSPPLARGGSSRGVHRLRRFTPGNGDGEARRLKPIALPGEGVPVAPASRSERRPTGGCHPDSSPIHGGGWEQRRPHPLRFQALAPPQPSPCQGREFARRPHRLRRFTPRNGDGEARHLKPIALPGEGVWFAPASRSERRPTGGCHPDSSPSHGEGWEGATRGQRSEVRPPGRKTPAERLHFCVGLAKSVVILPHFMQLGAGRCASVDGPCRVLLSRVHTVWSERFGPNGFDSGVGAAGHAGAVVMRVSNRDRVDDRCPGATAGLQ